MMGILIGRTLGTRIDDTGTDKICQDLRQIVLEPVSLGDLVTDVPEPQGKQNVPWIEITDIIGTFLVLFDEFSRRQGQGIFGPFLLIPGTELFDMLPEPTKGLLLGIGTEMFHELADVSKVLHGEGGLFFVWGLVKSSMME